MNITNVTSPLLYTYATILPITSITSHLYRHLFLSSTLPIFNDVQILISIRITTNTLDVEFLRTSSGNPSGSTANVMLWDSTTGAYVYACVCLLCVWERESVRERESERNCVWGGGVIDVM